MQYENQLQKYFLPEIEESAKLDMHVRTVSANLDTK